MNLEGERRLDLLQIIGFGVLIILPIHKLFTCSYLGKFESEINTMNFEEAKNYLIFDYSNLNPIEDLEAQYKNIEKLNIFAMAKQKKKIQFSESRKNMLQNDNFMMRAL